MSKIRLAICVGTSKEPARNEALARYRQGLTNLAMVDPEIEVHLPTTSLEQLLNINESAAREIDVLFIDAESIELFGQGKQLKDTLGPLRHVKVVAAIHKKRENYKELEEGLKEIGVVAMLRRPHTAEEAVAAIRLAANSNKPVANAATPAAKASKHEERQQALLVAVYSPEPGAGASQIAANLATALVKQGVGKVALLDLATEFADQRILFPVVPEHTENLYTLAERIDQLNSEMIMTEIMRRDVSGVEILYGASEPDSRRGQLLSEGIILRLLETLIKEFQFIIVDLPNDMLRSQVTLPVIDRADKTVLVVGPRDSQLKYARRFVDFLRRSDFPEERILAVVNKDGTRDGFGVEHMERVLSLPIGAQVRYDPKTVRASGLAGETFALRGTEPIGADVRKLALVLGAQADILPVHS